MKYYRGITLIEVIVYIAVLGILMAIAIPNYQAWQNSQQVRNIAESIQNGVRTAQMEAVKRNQQVVFWMVSNMESSCTLSSSASWMVALQNPTGNCDSDNVDDYIQKVPRIGGATGPTVTTTPANTNCVAFNGFGQSIATPACTSPVTQITVTGDTRRQNVIINQGSIRMSY